MQVEAFGLTDVGKVREHNEDYLKIDPSIGLHIVCDGMGGHAAGEVASDTAANSIQRFLLERKSVLLEFDGSEKKGQEVANLLNQAVMFASKTVFDVAASDKGKHGMGTTCVVLLTLGDKGWMANVGDSRLYLARDKNLYQLSTDHNFMNEAVAQGLMSLDQAAQSPHANVLTRAVGAQPSVCADMLVFDILAGDTFLLCSDGLHEYTKDPLELCTVLSGDKLQAIPDALVKKALEGGGHDNISAIIVRAVGREERQRERKTSITRGLDALGDIELFRDLTMAELVKVYNVLNTSEVAPGARIIQEGDKSEHLYVVVDGVVEVEREGSKIAALGPGTHFGEMALLNQRARSATVTALQRTKLLSLDRNDFQNLMAHEPAIATKFLWKFAQTLSLRLDDAYLARDVRTGRQTMGLGEYPSSRPSNDYRKR
ncbi:MAG: cyclic nucleotide-binding domain-containing protein [Myxococcales bacterium]